MVQFNERSVQLSGDAKSEDAHTIVHHFVGRLIVDSELIAAESV